MKKVFRITVICIVLACLVVGYYYYLSHTLSSTEEVAMEPESDLDRVLAQDFNANYPETPREVIRWYNRIITLYYSENLNNEQLEGLCDQAQRLMDAELLGINPRNNYIASVKLDIQDYHNRGRKIISSDVGPSANVQYRTVNGEELAYVTSYYLVSDGSDYQRSYQTYALRMDNQRRYKILAFDRTDEYGNPLR